MDTSSSILAHTFGNVLLFRMTLQGWRAQLLANIVSQGLLKHAETTSDSKVA